ncbi:MAG: FapA family protein [Gammaproteobacteria bacterium]|nr:FapA family protein [Gammaproteobacteria bacterium]
MEIAETPQQIGLLAVRLGMVSGDRLQAALAALDGADDASALVRVGLLTQRQLRFLLGAREMKNLRYHEVRFGRIVVESGYATELQIEEVLQRQKQQFLRQGEKTMIGDMLVADGTITEEEKQHVIATQQHLAQLQAAVGESAAVPPQEGLLCAADGIEITLSKDKLRATLRVLHPQQGSISLQQVHAMAQEYGIVYGLADDATIGTYLQQVNDASEPLPLAAGTPCTPGHGGEIRYHFDTNPLKAGRVEEDGVIDFKDRGDIPQVAEGALLAELSAPTPGHAGTDIHGAPLPPPEVRAKQLLCGHGVALSADGRAARASCAGTPSLSRLGLLAVFPVYRIKGDLGYKTGHVDFDGDIQVDGVVERDFHVTGGRLAASEIEAATVDIKGDVVVRGGIIGARIRAGGSLVAAYIHDSHIEVDGDLQVKREVIGCDIMAGGGFHSPGCTVLNSRIATKGAIIAGEVGSESAKPSTLLIGSDALLEARLEAQQALLKQLHQEQMRLRETLEEGEEENRVITETIAQKAQVQDRAQVEQRELTKEREALLGVGMQAEADALGNQIKTSMSRATIAEEEINVLFERQDALLAAEPLMRQQIETLLERIYHIEQECDLLSAQMAQQQDDLYLSVNGTLYPMTTITTAHTTVKNQQEMRALILRERHQRLPGGGEKWQIVTEPLK